MLRSERARRNALLAILLCGLEARAEAPGGGLDLVSQTYRDRNGVWVHTALASFRKALGRRLGIEWTQTYDYMSGASRSLGKALTGRIDSLHSVDGVSGASARESRHASRAVLRLGDADQSLSPGLYGSRERDYTSIAPFLGYRRRFNGSNTYVSADLAFHFDRSQPGPPFQDLGGKKRVGNLEINLTQTLTPLLLVGAGVAVVGSRGRLGHPYTPTVAADGALLDESLPRSRAGVSIFLQAIQGYILRGSLGAVDLQFSRYEDDWDLESYALDSRWTQKFPGDSYLRLRLRGYHQTGALFTRRPYLGHEAYHSADIRLRSFRSVLLGAKWGGNLPESWGAIPFLPDSWDLGYERTLRNTSGDRPGAVVLYQLYSPERHYTQDVARLGLHFQY